MAKPFSKCVIMSLLLPIITLAVSTIVPLLPIITIITYYYVFEAGHLADGDSGGAKIYPLHLRRSANIIHTSN